MSPESRSRMISLRLTAEEYDCLRELCFTHGIRSVSEMARTAINMLLQDPALVPQESLDTRVAELESRLHMLALEVKKLNQSTQTRKGATTTLTFSQSSTDQ